jgi:K+-transporting ATPase ATPase C chain
MCIGEKMKLFYQAITVLLVISVMSGAVYPLIVTGVGQLVFADKANGSLITKNHHTIGSVLIGQQFKRSEYFWPRPSASNYSAIPSAASNLGPTSAELKKQITTRKHELALAHGVNAKDISPDLVTTSGSGLDPHISVDAAKIQVKRILLARKLEEKDESRLNKLIHDHVEKPQLGVLGEPRINVLLLNLALDKCCSAAL